MSLVYAWDKEALISLLVTLFTGIPSGVFGLVCYVLRAMALYTIAQRRQIQKAWLSWIPVFSCWILGSLSDQYRYVTRGQVKSKRKWLLGLNILNLLVVLAILILVISMVVSEITRVGHPDPMIFELGVLFSLFVPLLLLGMAITVFRFMALYDVYASVDPSNAVLFLVLSILVKIVEPFFLFFNREKDTGMPPRRDTAQASQPAREPENKDYL